MNSTLSALFNLIRVALTNDKTPLQSDIDWHSVYNVAQAHRVTALVYYGVKNLGVSLDTDVKNKFEESVFKHTLIDTERDYEISRVLNAFEEAGIDHAPLKGLVVRGFYPHTEMRTLGDVDILIKESDIEKASDILNGLGFTFELESSHELKWRKGQTLVLELHKKFIGNGIPKYYHHYEDVDSFLTRKDSSHKLEMNPCDLMVFLTVHIAKHYISGGIGLRHFIDLYVLGVLNPNEKESYIIAELSKLGLDDFYRSIKRMLSCWFENTEYDEISSLMTRKILASGTFGNSDSRFIANTAKKSRRSMFLEAVFLPYQQMEKKYPVLNKCPFLLPVFWIVRIANVLVKKQDKVKWYKRKMKMVSAQGIKKYNEELKLVGIK